MVTRKNFDIGGVVGISLFVTFSAFAQAQTPFDFTLCVAGPTTMLSSSQELLIVSVELKGIIMSDHENKVFDNFAYTFLGLSRIMDGQIDARGYAKLTDLDGDFVFTETTTLGSVGKPAWKWKFLYGTGKWKGITGGADVRSITKRWPLIEGTYMGCYKTTGTFELPK